MKKFLRVLLRIFEICLIIFTVCVMVFMIVSFSTVEQNDRSIFGYRIYIVLSDSMQGTFEAGDMIVCKPVNVNELEPGDVISFKSSDPSNYGVVVTHKIREIGTTDGELSFITYGTTTGVDDAYPALASDVLGEYAFRLPKMGNVFEFLKTPVGYLTIIFIPLFLILVILGVRLFRSISQYRTQQREDMEREKAELEQQKLINQQMQRELEMLRQYNYRMMYDSEYNDDEYDGGVDEYVGEIPQPYGEDQPEYYYDEYGGYDDSYDEYGDGNYENW